jgi:hypothetical protein
LCKKKHSVSAIFLCRREMPHVHSDAVVRSPGSLDNFRMRCAEIGSPSNVKCARSAQFAACHSCMQCGVWAHNGRGRCERGAPVVFVAVTILPRRAYQLACFRP